MPWGLSSAAGVVIEVYGLNTAKPQAVVEVDIGGATPETVSVPIQALEPVDD